MPKTELLHRGPNQDDIDKLTDKQREFINQYLIHRDSTKAAKAAGYKPGNASQQGAKLMSNPIINRVIGVRERKHGEEQDLKGSDVILQLFYCVTRNARDYVDEDGKIVTNVNELNDRACAAIDGIEQDVRIIYGPDGEIVGEQIKTKLKLVPKASAIDMAMKHKGLFDPEIEREALELPWDKLYADGSNDPDEIEELLE
jgi:phage terminase small subunit